MKPILAITMGDPGGVGPEITAQALADESLRRRFTPLLIGLAEVFREAASLVGAPLTFSPIGAADDPAAVDGVAVLAPEDVPSPPLPKGVVDARCGEAAFRCIETSIRLALNRRVAAVVTNPIHKKALHLAGHRYAGHTEILRDLTGAPSSAMMLVAEGLRVVHVTTHIPLREVPDRIRRDRVLEVIRLADRAMRSLGIQHPRIGLAGLNPHGSDEGLFGDEEAREIAPAAGDAREHGIDVSDPLPPDIVFPLARGGRYDVVVAQYHDQGHIPVKLLGFLYDERTGGWTSVAGINVTLGLPVLRVSVDHGTAFDRAWQGQASPASLINAIDFAIRMICTAPSTGGPQALL